jgi:DNA-binding transcriptional ArsR family regulator
MTALGDFHAMMDVLRELAEDSDSLGVDEALAAIEALGLLQSELRRTLSMVETAAKTHLESGARQLGSRVYALKPEGKWRYRHDDIDRTVLKTSLREAIDSNGVIEPEAAARWAIRWMAALYRAPSTVPKSGALEDLGFKKRRAIADWETTGRKIEVIDMDAPEEARD